jgi:hypothetical protein
VAHRLTEGCTPAEMPVGTVFVAGPRPYGPHMTRRTKLALGIGAAAATAALAFTISSDGSAAGANVTRGSLHTFAAGASLDIDGHAQMVRRPSGTTVVALHVEGLTPGGSYASHVHKQACRDGDADGHFQQAGPTAGTVPPNEIWPGGGPWTANPAGNADVRTTAPYVAAADAVSVVVHDLSLPATANKVACADLT